MHTHEPLDPSPPTTTRPPTHPHTHATTTRFQFHVSRFPALVVEPVAVCSPTSAALAAWPCLTTAILNGTRLLPRSFWCLLQRFIHSAQPGLVGLTSGTTMTLLVRRCIPTTCPRQALCCALEPGMGGPSPPRRRMKMHDLVSRAKSKLRFQTSSPVGPAPLAACPHNPHRAQLPHFSSHSPSPRAPFSHSPSSRRPRSHSPDTRSPRSQRPNERISQHHAHPHGPLYPKGLLLPLAQSAALLLHALVLQGSALPWRPHR